MSSSGETQLNGEPGANDTCERMEVSTAASSSASSEASAMSDTAPTKIVLGNKIGFKMTSKKGLTKKMIKDTPVLLNMGMQNKKEQPEKDYISGINDGQIKSLVNKENGPLVIPLLENEFANSHQDGQDIAKGNGDNSPEKNASSSDAPPAAIKLQTKREREKDRFEKVDAGSDPNAKVVQYGLVVPSNFRPLQKEEGDRDMGKEESTGSRAARERWEGKDDKPLLLKNRPAILNDITDEKEKFKADVNLRPSEPDRIDDYSKVPVESFGEALLRGMGWAPGQPVGLSNAVVVHPVELKKRDHRMGLGAQKLVAPPISAKGAKKNSEKAGNTANKDSSRTQKRLDGDRGARGKEMGSGGKIDEKRGTSTVAKADPNKEYRNIDRDGRKEKESSRDRDRDRDRKKSRDGDKYRDRDRGERERER